MSVLIFLSTFLIVIAVYFIINDRRQAKINRVTGQDVQQEFKEEEKKERKQLKEKGLEIRLKQAGLRWNKYEYAAVAAILTILLALITYILVKGMFFTFLGALMGPFLLRVYIARKTFNRSEAMAEQFKPLLRGMANNMRGGKNLTQALTASIEDLEEPLRTEMEELYSDILGGATVSEAFSNAEKRIPVPEFKTISLGVKTSQITGSNLAETFFNASKMIEKRQEGKEKAYTATQSIRSQSTICTVILAIVFFIARFAFGEFYIKALNTFLGQAVLFGFIVVIILMNLYIKRKLETIHY